MRKFIEKLISRIKGYEYKLDENISISDLFGIVIQRLSMYIRGKFFHFKRKGKFLFIGKKVKIQCPRKIQIGSGATIDDYCNINALSVGGVCIGNNFTLGKKSVIDCTGVITELGESLVIGDNVGVSPNFLAFVRGKIIIGDNTIIGPNVTMIAENHNSSDINKAINEQGTTRRGICIGNNCWIGANVTILDGVSIGEGSIVAAGAVVTKSIKPFSVMGGIPARLIKMRD